jgi:hypothetical protein
MLTRELVERLCGAGGCVFVAPGAPTDALASVAGARPYVEGAALGSADVLVVAVPDSPGLRALLPDDLPLGAHVVLLADSGAADVPVGWLLDALGSVGIQVVEAVPLADRPPTTDRRGGLVGVVGVRTDTLVVPGSRLALRLGLPDLTDDAVAVRLVGEHILGALAQGAREQWLVNELKEAQARPTAQDLAGVQLELELTRAELEQTKSELARLRQSRPYLVARKVEGGLRRARHPRRTRPKDPPAAG